MTCSNCHDDPCLKYIGCPGSVPTKPFARAVPYDWQAQEGWGTHAVEFDTPEGDRLVWPGNEAYATASAARLTAAVEQRERQLRGRVERLRLLVSELGDAASHLVRSAGGPNSAWPSVPPVVRAHKALVDHLLEQVDDDDHYVPLHEHAITVDMLRDLRVVVDALTEDNPRIASELAPFLEAKGLRKATDAELIEQIRQRGYMVINPRKTPKPSEAAMNGDLRTRGSNALFGSDVADALALTFSAPAQPLTATEVALRDDEWRQHHTEHEFVGENRLGPCLRCDLRMNDPVHRRPPVCRHQASNGAECSLSVGHEGAHGAGPYTWLGGTLDGWTSYEVDRPPRSQTPADEAAAHMLATGVCPNRDCSRFNTHHPGSPCDSRRAARRR